MNNTSLVPESMARNWNQYKYLRAAAGLPWIQQPEVLVVDQATQNNKGGFMKHGLAIAGIIGVGVLLLFSFRVERKGKRG